MFTITGKSRVEPAPSHPLRRHRPLLVMVGLMALLTIVSAAGTVADDRVLLGAPVWGKPLKFAMSFVVYGLSLAWMLALPLKAPRWAWWMGTLIAVTGILDVGIVVVQAARGTFSHFNQSDDPFNTVIQLVFGYGVQGLLLANLVLAGILIFQRIVDRPTAWAIRSGMALVIAGIGLGLLIPARPQPALTVKDANGQWISLAAQHSVGVQDGGPGLPLTGWSTAGGDLRISHFVGLHGLQVMLVVALLLRYLAARVTRLQHERTQAALVIVAAVGYTALLALVTWQALRGQPLLRPDGLTLGALALVLAVTAAAGWAVLARSPGRRRRTSRGGQPVRTPAAP
ncbi:hypothetical protein [Nonomuraea typhae]|uniref:hypothetical protein n=1 Tax=Nonomuraea typhae TaxID=2603600 RepID=UPI0015E21533|nr:hypothetical protein [Nonomuraea typhae]